MDSEPVRMLTIDEILAAKDIEERVVDVPQWPTADGQPGKVRIRTFSKRQADKMRRDATRTNPKTGQPDLDTDRLEALLFVEGVIEPKVDLATYQKLLDKSAVAVALIQQAIMSASGLNPAAVQEAAKSDEEGPEPEVRVQASAGPWYDAARLAQPNVVG